MCDQCFAWQKMSVLTSNCDQFMGNSGPPCKSSTLPSFGSNDSNQNDKENIVEVLNVVPKDGAKTLTRYG